MFGELNVGHAYHGGGDVRRGKTVGTGMLAADLRIRPGERLLADPEDLRAAITRCPNGASPLARADLNIKPGQWLVAIDGRPLAKGEDYLRRLANRAGQEVELSINDTPKLEGARRVVVKTVANDTRDPLRRPGFAKCATTWTRRATARSATSIFTTWAVSACGSSRAITRRSGDKRGLIMDDRWNHGGFVAPMILAHLDRKILAVGGTRYGNSRHRPGRAFHGHMAALDQPAGRQRLRDVGAGVQGIQAGPGDRHAHLGRLGRDSRRQAVA